MYVRGPVSAFYRSGLPSMVLAFRDNHFGATKIDAGEVCEVVGPAQDDRFVVVEGSSVFECDLKARSQHVPEQKACAVLT